MLELQGFGVTPVLRIKTHRTLHVKEVKT